MKATSGWQWRAGRGGEGRGGESGRREGGEDGDRWQLFTLDLDYFQIFLVLVV
jgi:hypothetical protein